MTAANALPPEQLVELGSWVTVLRRADEAVCKDSAAGFTTLVGFCLWQGKLVGASCGDSALLAVDAGGAEELTRRQAKNPPVGSGVARFTPFAAVLAAPWAVLAVSDGVWKYAGWDQVRKAATALRGQAVLEALQAKARLPGNGRFPDDFTACSFRMLTDDALGPDAVTSDVEKPR